MATTKMELLITGDATAFLAAMKNAETAAKAGGVQIQSSVKTGAKEAEGALSSFAGASASAAQSYIKDQRMQGRQASFLARELLDLGLAGKESGEAMKSGFGLAIEVLGGLRHGLNAVALGLIAFEAVKFVASIFQSLGEASKKAAEEMEGVVKAMEKIADRTEELRAKRVRDTEGDKEQRKLEGALAVARQLQAAKERYESESGGVLNLGDSQEYDLARENLRTWEAKNGEIGKFISQQGRLVAELRAEEEAARRAALAESQARGNTDYEMAGGDGGASLAAKQLDATHARFAQMSADAAAISAKARGASEEELERLRLKTELLTLHAQLNAAATTEEEKAIRRRIAAAREESEAKLRDLKQFGPGNATGEAQFGKDDKAAREQDRQGQDISPSAYDQYAMPEAFGDAGLRAKIAADQSKKDAADLKAAWSGVGSSISGVFGQIASSIGGPAGTFVSAMGDMLAKTLALIVALATSDALMTGPLGVFAAIPMAAGILASVIGMISGIGGREVGGAVNTGVPTWVGEAGREVFVPSVSGYIMPNSQLAGGGGVTVNLSLSALDLQSFESGLRRSDNALFRVIRDGVRAGRI